MSADETQTGQVIPTRVKVWLTAGIAVVVVGLVLLTAWRPAAPVAPKRSPGTKAPDENSLETARQTLAQEPDASACRTAVQQINSYLGQAAGQADRPPIPSDEQAQALRQTAGLEQPELDEIRASNYTPLDAKHIEYCLLLRDAAQSLEVRGGGEAAPHQDPLTRARAAFDWVVRQVRLQPSGPATPDLVLRRGSGTEADRALIFLSLLRQLGPQSGPPEMVGALLLCPGAKSGQRLWACGVTFTDGHGLYLFDPRLGMALPGPGGQGVATLADVCTKPDVLAQLDVPGAPRYDVTTAQARAAQVMLFCPLSSLAPRMRHLQDVLLPPAVEVRLAADVPAELDHLRAAVKPSGDKEKPPPIAVWHPGVGLWQRFLEPKEGGVAAAQPFPVAALPGFALPDDQNVIRLTPEQQFQFGLVPWLALPPFFQDNTRFPYNVGLGLRVRGAFARPFLKAVTEAGPREWMLRGHFRRAASDLVQEREHWQQQRQRLRSVDRAELVPRVLQWVDQATAAYAAELRARSPDEKAAAAEAINEVWKQATDIDTLLQGAAAGPRLTEVTYQLALCTHEKAQRLQARVDLLRAGASESDRAKAREAWEDAVVWWKNLAELDWRKEFAELGWWKESPAQLENQPEKTAARRLRAQAEESHGDTAAAARTAADVSGSMTDLEKLASLYHARRLSAQKGK
jgi:transglutaminase-like putative cysteine protease